MATRKRRVQRAKAPFTEEEIDTLAKHLVPRLIKEVQASHHEFWIDPKSHYDEHHGLREMLMEYGRAKGVFWKAFIWTLGGITGVISVIGLIRGWFNGH